MIAIHGLWLITNANFVGNFFEVYFAEYSENEKTFSTLFLTLLAPPKSGRLKQLTKSKVSQLPEFFQIFSKRQPLCRTVTETFWNS